jgi:hypothetical protein
VTAPERSTPVQDAVAAAEQADTEAMADAVRAEMRRIRNAPYPPPAHQLLVTASGAVDLSGAIVRDIRADGSFDPIHWVQSSSGAVVADFREYAEPMTEVIPAIPVAPALVDDQPAPGRRPRSLLRSLVNAASLGLLTAAAFLAGQWTTQVGVEPVLPMPIADVQTAAQTARLWTLGTDAERAQQCGWLATLGDTRDYVLAKWVAHLRAPEGGRLDDVDPAVVAGVLDDACAGRAPGRKG